jgi:hypothetical protein
VLRDEGPPSVETLLDLRIAAESRRLRHDPPPLGDLPCWSALTVP